MLQRSLVITGVVLAAMMALFYGAEEQLSASVAPGNVTAHWALVLAAVVAVYAGAHGVWRRGAALRTGIVAAMLALGWLLVAQARLPELPAPWLAVGVLVSLPLALAAEVHSGAAATPAIAVRIAQALSIHLAALALYVGLLASGTGITVVAVAVASATLAWLLCTPGAKNDTVSRSRIVTSSVVVGLVVAQAAWPLLYWRTSVLAAGVVLAIVFYASTGIVHSDVQTRAGRWRAAEYAAVALGGLAIVLGAAVLAR